MADHPERPDLGEIAVITGGRDITRGFVDSLGLLESQDSVLNRRGGDLKVYEEILRDDQVTSTFQQRRLAVVSREVVVEVGGTSAQDKRAADFMREQLAGGRWDEITNKMLFGVFYGFSVAECLWALDGGQVVIEDIKVRNRRRFKFGIDGKLRLITLGEPLGEALPERKFWCFEAGADNDDDPYGRGLGHWLYWPCFFKRNDIKFWLIFLEKFGMPTAVGKHPPQASQEERDRLMAAIKAVATEAGIIVPEGFEIELLEAARSGTADYAAMYEAMNAAISKVVLSQTMTTDEGSSLSQSQVHMEVRDEVVAADAGLVNASFNRGPVTWLTEWNFPGARPPRVSRRVESDPDLKPVAERDKLLFEMGYQPTEEYIAETYGEGFERMATPPGGPATPPTPGTAFAERTDDDAIDELARDMLEGGGWEPLMKPAIAPIRAALAKAATFEEAKALIDGVIGDADRDRLVEALARAGFQARLAGAAGGDLGGSDTEDVV